MDGPNPELMELYGTDAYYLEKIGALPPLVHALTGAASFGVFLGDREHQEKLLAEAEAMNNMLRAVEAEKMEGVISGFEGRPPPPRLLPDSPDLTPTRRMAMAKVSHVGLEPARELDDGAMKVAEAWGRGLAQQMYKYAQAEGDEEALELLEKVASGVELTEMEKQALGAIVGKAIGAIGKAFKGVGGRAKGLFSRTPKAGAPGVPKPPAPGGAAAGVAKATPTPTPPPIGSPAPAPKTGGPTGPSTPAQPQQSWWQRRKARQAEAGVAKMEQAGAQSAAKVTPTAAGFNVEQPKGKWLTPWRKAKIGLGAAAIGTGYLGLKTVQAGRDVMLSPMMTGGQYGKYGPQVAHSVNPYGYVTPYG